ncbi:hypothetical protein JOQ06_029054, partial [Pogonophryne albipinna]
MSEEGKRFQSGKRTAGPSPSSLVQAASNLVSVGVSGVFFHSQLLGASVFYG